MSHIDPRELNDLASFAAKGGLGRGVATSDCVAEEADQLMFITGDELILLRELPEVDLAACEGVVGWVKKGQVEFAKIPPRRSSSIGASSLAHDVTPKTSVDLPRDDSLPRTVLTAPSPSPPSHERMLPLDFPPDHLDAPRELKRVSGPFELESPQQSPNLEQANDRFSIQQAEAANQASLDPPNSAGIPLPQSRPESQIEVAPEDTEEDDKRESILSMASSEMYGGIGGFMMGHASGSEDSHETLQDEGVSPTTASVETPFPPHSDPSSPRIVVSDMAGDISGTQESLNSSEPHDDEEWDIYDQYARESMYAPLARRSLSARRASKMSKHEAARESMGSFDAIGAVNAARAALEGGGPNGLPTSPKVELDPQTPKQPNRSPLTSPLLNGPTPGRSVAMDIRLRIQREREAQSSNVDEVEPPPPVRSSSIPARLASGISSATVSRRGSADREAENEPKAASVRSSPESISGQSQNRTDPDQSFAPESEELVDTVLETPIATDSMTVAFPGAAPSEEGAHDELIDTESMPTLLASPVELDPSKLESALRLEAPAIIKPPEELTVDPIPSRSVSPLGTTSLTPGPPPNAVINKHIPVPWSPDSPASPHSITATRQAVEAHRSVSEGGGRPRGLTLVGRIDADLRVARGPVPITFAIGDAGSGGASRSGLGLGLPPSTNSGRTSPVTPEQRSRSPLSGAAPPPPPPMPDDLENIRSVPSRFPTPKRSFTSPMPPEVVPPTMDAAAGPRPGFFAARPRSRSFGAAMAKAVGRSKKATPPTISTETLPSISTEVLPSVPSVASPASPTASRPKFLGGDGRNSPLASPVTPQQVSGTISHHSTPGISTTSIRAEDAPSIPPNSARSSSFSFSSKTSKTPRKASRALPSPVSHKDFEDTINAGGMDFELVGPKRGFPLSPTAINTLGLTSPISATLSDDADKATLASASSIHSLSSRAAVPDTDEWGFIKEKSVTPEIFQSRSAPVDHRAAEVKWLAVIGSPVPAGGPSRKVKRYVLDGGVPSSLRGKVWSWFLSSSTARVPGQFETLSEISKQASLDQQIDKDITKLWSDHSLYYLSTSPGFADLRSVLRAYSAWSSVPYSTPMCHLAGALVIHSVAEDAFWLLTGMMEAVLKEYYDASGPGIRVDAGVFDVVLRGSEKDLATTFRQVGIKSAEFLDKWYKQLFIRCLPWPTALRVIDVVVSEGPRFMLVASLTILTLSKDRLMALPKTRSAIMDYLEDLPQDSLLLPENFMKATERVKFKEEDWKKLRAGVEKDLKMPLTPQSPAPATPAAAA